MKERFINKYGKKYSYDNFIYYGYKEKSFITCPIHGDFLISPYDFLKGKECPSCIKEKKFNINNVKAIEKAKMAKHGKDVGFEKFKYYGRHKKSIFICPKHGEFEMEYGAFCNGQGCPKCAKERHGLDKRLDEEEIIKRIRKVNKKGYSLEKFKYKGSLKNSIFICPKHGEFEMTPAHFLNGEICPKCAVEERGIRSRCNEKDVIKRFNDVFKSFYDYSKFKYVDMHSKSTVICPLHGEFSIDAMHHLRGQGCPICSSSHMERNICRLLEENNIKFEKEFILDKKKKYRYDFFLPSSNILIECQGEQHYVPINFKSTYDYNEVINDFNKLLKRDNEKYNFAIFHGYNIIYFVDKSNFHDKSINVRGNWYDKKNVFENEKELLDNIYIYKKKVKS